MSFIKKILPWFLASLMVLAAFFLMFNASSQESATMDELAHIPSGYGYVKYLDYRLNPEHPPVVKALAALPLLFQNLNFPTNQASWQTDVNGQWNAGTEFLYQSGNNPDNIIQWARLFPMFLTLLLIIFIYVWAKELIGRWWALLPTFLAAFSPTFLAHGHYVTTDVGAALGIFISTYYFVKFLLHSTRRNLILSGLTFGLAQLMKFSAVLVIPLFGFLIIAFAAWETRNQWLTFFRGLGQFLKSFFRYLLYLIGIFIIGYILVYLVYFVFTINYPVERQKADTQFILSSFSGGPDLKGETCKLNSGVSIGRHTRCLAEIDIAMAGNKILRPLGHYILGVLMVMQRSSGGNTAYFLGQLSNRGWWYYFPVIFILKEPLPSLILIALTFLLALWGIIIKKIRTHYSLWKSFLDYLGTHFAEFSMISFVILYWVYSLNSPLNIGIRHILPTVPFIYILTTSGLKKWINGKMTVDGNLWKRLFTSLANLLKMSFKGIIIAVLILWYLTETIFAAPQFLPYFNQLAGGSANGYKYVTDSNYDWGQDLKRLVKFVDDNKIDKIAVDYFGGGNPKYYLGNKVEYWWSARGNPKDQGIEWLAVSINTLQGAFGKLSSDLKRKPEDEYQWLKNPYQPYSRAGESIFIYKL